MAKTVGIVGGMGPLATIDLFRKIVESTPATTDQDHLHIIIDNYPQIPPRVEAILERGESPLPKLVESVCLLERAGVDFIVIACNTAHYWFTDLQKAIRVPVYNMVSCAASYIAERSEELSGPVLLLATLATIRTNLYQDAFAACGLGLQLPEPQEQEVLDKAVREIKSGELAQNPYLAEIRLMLDKHATEGTVAVLAGCTEVPLLFPYLGNTLKRFDATAILAEKVVKEATAE